jgi:hypothetical protein
MAEPRTLNSIGHFGINVNDTDRAVRFYSEIFGWKVTPWGPPGFYLVDTPGIGGAIQKRQDDPFPTHIGNFECTITVDDVDRVCGEIVARGGKVTLAKTTIPGVADIARVEDTEGNTFTVARYLVPSV